MNVASGVAPKRPGLSMRYRLASRLLRVALVVLLIGTLLAQVLVPVEASQAATIFPEVEYLVVPYSVAGILAIVCVQVALIVVWRLLSLVDSGTFFTRRTLRWVDVIIACAVVATVLSAGVMTHLLAAHGGGPGVILGLAATLACGLAFVLLMVVIRGVTESVIADRTGPDEGI